MGKLRRYYNQNRKKIWQIIIIIGFAFLMLRLANFIAKKQNEQNIQNVTVRQQANAKNNIVQGNTSQGNSSNTQVNKKTTETEVVKQFISYCNKKDLENAYNMITDECKEQMFNDIETFERIYYNSAFEGKSKDVVVDNWTNHTYLVYFKESALSTGKAKDENQRGDYITVVKDKDGNYKLNINNYIGYKEINKTKENQNIKMEVICSNAYMNYEEYKIKVTNQSDEEIILDRLTGTESIYLEDSKGMKYPFYGNELSIDQLTIPNGHTKIINIKFYNSYSSSKEIKTIVFSNLIKNNNQINYKIEL